MSGSVGVGSEHPGAVAPSPGPRPARASLAQRLRATAVDVLAALACRLPEGLLAVLADGVGLVWYRLRPVDAEQARRNLGRVAAWCAAAGLGPARVRAAASDRAALERLVRTAFRHRARYYLEVLRVPSYDDRYLAERFHVETPETVAEAVAHPGGIVLVGLHFGALEIASLYVVRAAGRPAVAPMETIPDAVLQAWFVRTRSRLGVRIVDLQAARRVLPATLAEGGIVGLIADRDLTGGGVEVPLFGAPCPLPVGPAVLAVEGRAPLYVGVAWRTEAGRYRGRLEPLPVPVEGRRRERVLAVLEAEARTFERLIAVAPEQWWAVFFPLWPDLAVPRPARAGKGPAEARERAQGSAPAGPETRPGPGSRGGDAPSNEARPAAVAGAGSDGGRR